MASAFSSSATAEKESTASVLPPSGKVSSDQCPDSPNQDGPLQHDDERDDCMCPDCIDNICGVSEMLIKAFLSNTQYVTQAARSVTEKALGSLSVVQNVNGKEDAKGKSIGKGDSQDHAGSGQVWKTCPEDESDDSEEDSDCSDDTDSEESGILFLPTKYQAKLFMSFSEGILRSLLSQLLNVTASSKRDQRPCLYPRGFPKLDNIDIGELIYLMTYYEPAALKVAELTPDILPSVEVLLLEATGAEIRAKALSGEDHAMMCQVCINDSVEGAAFGESSDEEYDELCYYSLLLLCVKNAVMTINPEKLASLVQEKDQMTRSLIALMHSGLLPTMWTAVMICLYVAEMGGERCAGILRNQGLLAAAEKLLLITEAWKQCAFTLCLRKHTDLLVKALRQPGSVDFFKQKSREDRFLLRHGHQECLMTETLDDVTDVCPSWPITCSAARCWRSEEVGRPFKRCERCGFARYCSGECMQNHLPRHAKDCFTREDLMAAIQEHE
ncbi:Hypp1560 [Branchiostoma lanceolatum]|uniref:Hypp1560 protein n=1 Tax=Branchiostoma lanceolatum TaxID=7740 RepID=A0A8J9ZJ32_BRALA|nr:Hypp1560 [Branchiostoma lanceolatum]